MNGELLADQPLGQKLIKKGFWLYLFAYLIAPAGYVIRMLISNSLSVEEVGVLYSIISLIGLLNIYNDLGLSESLLYFLPRYWIKKQYNYAKTAIILSLSVQVITAIIISILLWFFAPRLSQNYFHHESALIILRYFCLYFIGINIFQTLTTIYSAFQDTFSNSFIEFIKILCVLSFTFFFFINNEGSIANYSLNRLFGLGMGIVIGIIIFAKKYSFILKKGEIILEKPMLREYAHYALWVFIGTNAGGLLGNIAQQLIIIILGAGMAGYYSNYLSLFSISSMIVGPIMSLIFPLVSEIISKNQKKRLAILQNFFYTYLILFSSSLVGLFIILGKEISIIIFGEKFLFSGLLLVYSAPAIILTTLIGFNFNVLAGLGKIKERVKIISIVALINILLNIFLLPIWGIWGAIISLLLGLILMYCLSYLIINRNEQIKIQRKLILRNIPIIILLSGTIYILKNSLFVLEDGERYRNLLILVILGVGYYILFLSYNFKQILLLKNIIRKF